MYRKSYSFESDLKNATMTVERQKEISENALQGGTYIGNRYINRDLEFGEVNMAIDRLKNRKVVGTDRIPNEFLKYDRVKTV